LCGGGCEITTDRKRIYEASVVMFMMQWINKNDLPKPSTR